MTGTVVLRWCLAVALAAVAVAVRPPSASALEDYADEIQALYDLPDKPSCTFCHATDERGMSVSTPFQAALKNRGFTRRVGIPSLRVALASLEAMNVDTDGDGVIDVDELRAGANPNDPSDMGQPMAPSCAVLPWSPASAGSTLGWMLVALGCLAVRAGHTRRRP